MGSFHIKQNVQTHFGPKAAKLVFPIATAFSTIQEEKFVEQLKQVSPNAYEYLDNIDMEHWCNIQWIKTWKYPPEARLPPRYGVVTSNTSECINSMIDDNRSERWTDLLEGVLQKMPEKISENRQQYRMVDEDDVVSKVKQVLKECFCAAAAMQVVELEVGQKYVVTETYSAMINLNQPQVPPTTQMEHQQSNMPIPSAPLSVKTNVLAIPEKTCSCSRWQEFKYPCRHAVAYLRKWEDMSFPAILDQDVHDYYKNKSMQQIYEYNVFPVVQDQIRYNGETYSPAVVARQWIIRKQNISRSRVISSTQKSPQSSSLSVEREDIIVEHVPMCHCDMR